LVLSPSGLINLGFTTEGRLAAVLIITFSWGFQLGGYIYKTPTSTPHHQQVFWRRCQGERRFLQGESLASNLLLCYCFALFYFYLHCFIKNTKNSSFIVVIFTCLLLVLLEWVFLRTPSCVILLAPTTMILSALLLRHLLLRHILMGLSLLC
jgi:hypothetical protein